MLLILSHIYNIKDELNVLKINILNKIKEKNRKRSGEFANRLPCVDSGEP